MRGLPPPLFFVKLGTISGTGVRLLEHIDGATMPQGNGGGQASSRHPEVHS